MKSAKGPVPPFIASVGRPPNYSFAEFGRYSVGEVKLSARQLVTEYPTHCATLQTLLGKQLQGNSEQGEEEQATNPTHELNKNVKWLLGLVQVQFTAYTSGGMVVTDDGEQLESDTHSLEYQADFRLEEDFPIALNSPPVTCTDIVQRYLACLENAGECSITGPHGYRPSDSIDLAFCAQTFCSETGSTWEAHEEEEEWDEDEDEDEDYLDTMEECVWNVMEGIVNIIRGPFAYGLEQRLDTEAFSVLSMQDQFWAPGKMLDKVQPTLPENVAYIVPRYPGSAVPIGYARFVDPRGTNVKLALETQKELATMTRIAIAHTIFHLLAAHESLGTVYASALVCTRFIRFYVLGANRIAVEFAPASGELSGTLQTRAAVPYSALETTTRAFSRLPWGLTKDSTPRPVFPSIKQESYLKTTYLECSDDFATAEAERTSKLGALDMDGLQTYISFGAATAIRMGSLDRTQALKRMPTPLQDQYLAKLNNATAEVASKHGLPAELCLDISELSLGGKRQTAKDGEAREGLEQTAIHMEALEMALEEGAMFLPVSTAEMDALVAAQVESDLKMYAFDGLNFTPYRFFKERFYY